MRARVGDTHLTSIECAGPMVWLPIEADLAVQRALAEVIGPERTREFLLASAQELWTGSLVQTLVQTAIGFLGLDPGSLARLVPAAWGLLYRDCGQWSLTRRDERGPRDTREVELGLAGLPRDCASDRAWLASVATILHALLILCDREGEVELVESPGQDALLEVVFRLAWKTK